MVDFVRKLQGGEKAFTPLKQACSLIFWCQQSEIPTLLARISWVKEEHHFCRKILIPDYNILNGIQFTEVQK